MPAAMIRRSLGRGVVATLLMLLVATSAIAEEPTELHVISRQTPDAGSQETHGTE